MKVRYKNTLEEANTSDFNPHGCGEVLTHDDSVFIRDLQVFLNATSEWKDMSQAFKDRDIIPDNYNNFFGEPQTPEDRARGYFL